LNLSEEKKEIEKGKKCWLLDLRKGKKRVVVPRVEDQAANPQSLPLNEWR